VNRFTFSATTSAYDAAAPDPVFAEKPVVKFPPCKANILRLTPSKNILLIKIAAKNRSITRYRHVVGVSACSVIGNLEKTL